MRYLWDTNIAIYFLQQQLPPHAERFVDQTLAVADPAISVITEIELLCWKHASQEDLLKLREFVADATVFELTGSIKLQTAEVRKSHRMKLPDAIIAATALTYGLTLLTRNTADFSHVDGLNWINPFDVKDD
jgi:predicted nucleic acid-binding protein